MSLIRRSNVFDPFFLDLWDPFQGFPFGSGSSNSLFPSFASTNSETPPSPARGSTGRRPRRRTC
jgi:HSP20 family protein